MGRGPLLDGSIKRAETVRPPVGEPTLIETVQEICWPIRLSSFSSSKSSAEKHSLPDAPNNAIPSSVSFPGCGPNWADLFHQGPAKVPASFLRFQRRMISPAHKDSVISASAALNFPAPLDDASARAGQRLAEREALLTQAEQLANVGSWEWHASNGTLIWSDQLKTLVGMKSSNPPTSYEAFIQDFTLPDERRVWQEQWALCLRDTAGVTWEGRVVRPQGDTRRMRCRLQARHGEDGRLISVVGVMHDLTAWREAEESCQALEQQLSRMQKLEALVTLAGGLSHEFNNTLGAIMGHAEVAKMDLNAGHPANLALDEVVKASKRARDLVRRILTFDRSQENPQTPVALEQLIRDSLSLLRASIPSSIEIVREIQEGLPPVLADASQIHQVLLSLAINAARSMAAQGGVLTLRLEREVLRGHEGKDPLGLEPGEFVVLTVMDTGPEISPEALSRIFQPFYESHAHHDAAGIGLSVAYRILRSHGGGIEGKSESGKGSTFKIYLPAMAGAPVAEPASEQSLPFL